MNTREALKVIQESSYVLGRLEPELYNEVVSAAMSTVPGNPLKLMLSFREVDALEAEGLLCHYVEACENNGPYDIFLGWFEVML